MQVQDNLESQRRPYALADLARDYGFRDVVTIDDDLGRSASGLTTRPSFEALVAQLCQGRVGALFCLEASRLARKGREWHHLLELCGLVNARVVDGDGAYDPSVPNDRAPSSSMGAWRRATGTLAPCRSGRCCCETTMRAPSAGKNSSVT